MAAVSSSVSTLLGDSDVSVTQATNSTLMEPTAQVNSMTPCMPIFSPVNLCLAQTSTSVPITVEAVNRFVLTVMGHSSAAAEMAIHWILMDGPVPVSLCS